MQEGCGSESRRGADSSRLPSGLGWANNSDSVVMPTQEMQDSRPLIINDLRAVGGPVCRKADQGPAGNRTCPNGPLPADAERPWIRVWRASGT